MSLYYQDENVTLYHGDAMALAPSVAREADAVVTDPPYGDTALAWDSWVDGWPSLLPGVSSMWCFGSMRMFLTHFDEFRGNGWTYGQEIVWEKHNGSGFAKDRFKRVHELAVHFYRGMWADIHHEVPRVPGGDGTKSVPRRGETPHTGKIGTAGYIDDGLRLTRSVIRARSMHGQALHPTQKPIGILTPLIRYSCPPGGTVLDPFSGSGSTLAAAVQEGRKAIGIEVDERYCETTAQRLSQGVLNLGGAA